MNMNSPKTEMSFRQASHSRAKWATGILESCISVYSTCPILQYNIKGNKCYICMGEEEDHQIGNFEWLQSEGYVRLYSGDDNDSCSART